MPLTPEQIRQFNAARTSAQTAPPIAGEITAQQEPAPIAPPPDTEQDGGSGFVGTIGGALGGTLGAAADLVPEEIRDPLGRAAQVAFSGEEAVNLIGEGFGQENLGTRAFEQIERVPVVGDPLRFVTDVATAPATLLTAGFGGQLAAGIRGAGIGGRLIAAGLEPVTAGGFAGRLAAETGVEVAAAGGAEAARRGGLPAPVQLAAALAGGVVGIRAAGNIRLADERAFSAPAVEQLESDDSAQRLFGVLRNAEDLRPDLERRRRVETGLRGERQETLFQEARQAGLGVEEATRLSRRELAGELPRARFTEARPQLGAHEVRDLFGRIELHFEGRPRTKFVRPNTVEALGKLLDGDLPTPSEAKLLEDVFGPEMTAVIRRLPGARSTRERLLDIANIPRTLAASMDLSAPFRQGALLIGRPREFFGSFTPMARAAFREGNALQFDEVMRARPFFEMGDRAGLFLQDIGEAAAIGAREEAYGSHIARAVPGVRPSERGFATFLNRLRTNVFDNFVAKRLRALGIDDPLEITDSTIRQQFDNDLKSMADWINITTGRSTLSSAGQAGDLLSLANATFFSPRLLVSRLQVFNPRTYMNATPAVRREMVRDLVSFVGVGMTGLGMLKVAGDAGIIDAKVEVNPLSSDFGKGRIGNIRFDPWAGFQPIARYTAQLLSERRKTSGGNIVPQNRGVTVGRFAQSKLAPAPGALVDFLRGETFLGEEFEESEFLDEQAANRLMPLFLQDVTDVVEAEGSPMAALSTVPAFFGFGVTAFEASGDRRDRRASEEFGVDRYDSLSPSQKQQLERQFPDEFDGDFSQERLRIEDETKTQERQIMEQATVNAVSARQTAEAIRDLNTRRSTLTEEAANLLLPAGDGDRTDVRSRFFDLLDSAELAFGITDFQLRDQLEEEFRGTLTDEERAQLDEGREVHDPVTDWYFDARDLVRTRGYWALQSEAFNEQQAFIQQVTPDTTSYLQLFTAARTATNPSERAVLENLLKRVDDATARKRKTFRRTNADVDGALKLLYDDAPVATLLE